MLMRAWRVHEFGPPEVMKLERVERPEPGAGEVLVRVQAAGVGPWDALIRAGKSALPQPLPLTPGSDLSGHIVATGSAVSRLQVGDPVFGVTNPQFVGAYAEYATASAGMVARKPASLTHVEAASVPVVAITAWQALFDIGELAAGRTVVILGAAGNVGRYALQLARLRDVRTTAVVGGGDVSIARELGATSVIDYRTQRFEEHVRNADVVFDLVGGEMQTRAFPIIRPGGKLVSAVSRPDQELAARHGVAAAFFLVDVTSERLAAIADHIERGELTTHVGTTLPLGAAREAHVMLDRATRPAVKGKIVLAVDEN
jgi:NADPH:quinone reductase-like Zn-dependent oxidoreductase